MLVTVGQGVAVLVTVGEEVAVLVTVGEEVAVLVTVGEEVAVLVTVGEEVAVLVTVGEEVGSDPQRSAVNLVFPHTPLSIGPSAGRSGAEYSSLTGPLDIASGGQ